MSFTALKALEALRKNAAPRTEAANSRLEMANKIRASQAQEALKTELRMVRGYESRMNLPPHLRVRLAELTDLLKA